MSHLSVRLNIFVLEEDLLADLVDGSDGHGQDADHGDDPADGIRPFRVDVVALGQGFVTRPRVCQDDLKGFELRAQMRCLKK